MELVDLSDGKLPEQISKVDCPTCKETKNKECKTCGGLGKISNIKYKKLSGK